MERGSVTLADRPQMPDDNMETLARTYAPALKRFFQRRILEHADVDDLVQEVFLRLTRRGTLSDLTNVEGYVFQTAANILRDRLRQRFSHQVKDHQPIGEDHVEDTAFSPERVLLGREAVARLTAAIQGLPPRTQATFILLRVEGLSRVDAARRLDVSLSTLDKDMAKALDVLMEHMEEDL